MKKENESGLPTFKALARDAKRRMKSGYWEQFDRDLELKRQNAEREGCNPSKVAEYYVNSTVNAVNGKKNDDQEFYEKVKRLLLEYGEVSDAIGRLIDHDVYDSLPYERKQRYTLELSNKYLASLDRFRKEKELGLL